MGNNKFESSRDPENRSKKNCCCGGHNASNVKRNLHHHSTRGRLSVRFIRRFIKNFQRESLMFYLKLMKNI